jgi:hypothetical protein
MANDDDWILHLASLGTDAILGLVITNNIELYNRRGYGYGFATSPAAPGKQCAPGCPPERGCVDPNSDEVYKCHQQAQIQQHHPLSPLVPSLKPTTTTPRNVPSQELLEPPKIIGAKTPGARRDEAQHKRQEERRHEKHETRKKPEEVHTQVEVSQERNECTRCTQTCTMYSKKIHILVFKNKKKLGVY